MPVYSEAAPHGLPMSNENVRIDGLFSGKQPSAMQQQPITQDDSPIAHPALALALRLIVAAKANPSVLLLTEIRSQLQSSPVPPPTTLLTVALHPALPLLAADNPAALEYIRTLVKLCKRPIPLSFWPTAIGALSAASRRLHNESSRLECVLLMQEMFTESVGRQFSEHSFSRPFAHVIGALLESVRVESLKQLRATALKAIESLTVHTDPLALSPIAPGLLSGLAAVAAGDFKSGSTVLCNGIRCFTSVMHRVLNVTQDDAFRANASLLTYGIMRKRLYEGPDPTPRVRSALVSASRILLSLPLTENARAAWIDGLLALAEDSVVASEAALVLESVPAITADDVLRYLRKLSAAPRLQDVRSATRAIRLCPGLELVKSWRAEKDTIVNVARHLLAVDARAVTALHPRTIARLSPYYQISLANLPLHPDAVFGFLAAVVQSLACSQLMDLFTTCLASANPASMLTIECLIRYSTQLPPEVPARLLDESLFLTDADALPILLRCIGELSLRLREDFRPFLLHILFPVVLSIAHSSPIVSQAAVATTDRIAYALDYDSLTALISDNVDYLVDAISFRLSSPDAIHASRLLERLFSLEESSSALAPLLIDTITTVIDCLYETDLDPDLGLSFFRTLTCSVRALVPIMKSHVESVEPVECFYLPENVASRLASSVSWYRDVRAKEDDFRKSFDSEHRDFVPPHFQKGFDAHGSDDLHFEDDENAPDVTQEIGDDGSQEPSVEIKTIGLVVERCRHFIETPDLHLRHAVLVLIATCLQALSSHSDLLLPLVAKIWDPLKLAFGANSSRMVIQKALDVAEVVVSICPEFVAHRVSTDLWPSMKRVLVAEQRVLANALNPNALDRSSVIAQSHALRLLCSALTHPVAFGRIIGDVARVASAYLSESMPIILQETAENLFTLIIELDPDIAWWTLTTLLAPRTSSTPAGCIPLPLQWQAANPQAFQRRAAPLLEKLQALPEIRFDDFLNRDEHS